MLTQLSEVYFSFTVRETVEMGRYVRGIHSSHDREKIDECLELTGLEDMEDKQIGELSGGQMCFLQERLHRKHRLFFSMSQ